MSFFGAAIKAAIIKRVLGWLLDWIAGWLRAKARDTDPHAADLDPADRAESFTKHIPSKPKPRRTARRGPPNPPPSLSGT